MSSQAVLRLQNRTPSPASARWTSSSGGAFGGTEVYTAPNTPSTSSLDGYGIATLEVSGPYAITDLVTAQFRDTIDSSDFANLPVAAVINSVEFYARIAGDENGSTGDDHLEVLFIVGGDSSSVDNPFNVVIDQSWINPVNNGQYFYAPNHANYTLDGTFRNIEVVNSIGYATANNTGLTVNPLTGVSWVRNDFGINKYFGLAVGWYKDAVGWTGNPKLLWVDQFIIVVNYDPPTITLTGSGGVTVNSAADLNTPGTYVGSGGVTMSGTALEVLSVNISGIYLIVPDKTNDTLYVRDGSTDTVDVKIPDPFFETGKLGQ